MQPDIQQMRKKLIKKAKLKVREKYAGSETHIIRAINVLEDLDSVFNLFSEHAREWYSAHFPELDRTVKDNETYLLLVKGLKSRENFTMAGVEKQLKDKEFSEKIAEKASSSMGSDIDEKSLNEIVRLAESALAIKKQRGKIAAFIEKEMKALMPNFTALCGETIGAKMLNEAGSFRKLAILPSSTIQVLGAEKALFKHIKTGAKPPKYGLLFQHPLVKGAKAWQKGAVARAIAGKLAIAVKEDYFGKKDVSEQLRKDVERRVEEIKKQHPEPKRKGKRK